MAKILLIEPDRVLAGAYKQSLEAAGHSVVPVSSAQAAIIAADDMLLDVVILELQLIEHSGIEFLYEFRSYPEWYDIPVIIQTHVPPSEFNTNRTLLSKQLNVQTYLYKPHTSLHNLLRTITETQPAHA